jgi:hypothetical protein
MPVRYTVHREPKWLSTMKPPIIDASNGPAKTVVAKSVMASPLVQLLKISEKTAATTAIGLLRRTLKELA